VALNPQTGEVYAMGSTPAYNPRELSGPFATQAAYEAKFGKAAGAPLINRADESAYPTGSVFKPITSLAALASGITTPTQVFDDTGCYQTGARIIDRSCNARGAVHGAINLTDALRVSADTYFYDLGVKMYNKLPSQPLQNWAHKMGIGRRTGVDLPGESRGSVPSRAWVERLNRAELACRKKEKKASCGIGSGYALWNPGDNSNFAVGQGGLQATPLQMAVAYSTIINGGRVPVPNLGQQVEDDRGIVQRIDHPSARKVKIDPAWRRAIMDGLFEAANAKGGTSTEVWAKDWPHGRYPIFGKTGTAERQPQRDQSWYVAYSYDAQHPDDRPVVVVTTIEQGGFGAAAAAPTARLILSKRFNVAPKLVRGTSPDR
jgi:penicillin-binding protein 2